MMRSNFKLSDLLKIKNGKDHKSLSEGNIPVYGSGGLMRLVDEYIYDKPSILLPRKGSLQNIQYANQPFWTVDTLYYTEINEKLTAPYFLYYYLKSLNLENLNTGTGVPSMTFSSYYDLEINLPPLELQKIVAKFLENIDRKIHVNNQINDNLEALAKTIYDYWFVQFDFPDENGKPYKSSGGRMVYNEVLKREIPNCWEVKSLEDSFKIKKGTLITEKTANKDGKIKVVSAGVDFSYFHDRSNFAENTITISASGANAGLINFWREPIFACDCTTVRGKNLSQTLFALEFLKSVQDHIFNQAKGSAQPHVYPKDIEILKYAEPSYVLLNDYGKLVTPLNQQISNNLKENQELTQLRDWLLPMLMNGQVSVK